MNYHVHQILSMRFQENAEQIINFIFRKIFWKQEKKKIRCIANFTDVEKLERVDNLLQEHAKIVQFISLAKEVTGRKKFQKMIYIAKKMNFPFAEKYELHMYGPYSEELTLRVEELCEMGFLAEQCMDKGSYVQYKYNVTGEGERFLETDDQHMSRLADFIQ